jgi:hypothetical protein
MCTLLQGQALVSSPRLVWGTRWTKLWISLGPSAISMGKEGQSTPLISQDYKNTGLIRLRSKIPFYYSIAGEGGVWNFPSCVSGMIAFVTTTNDKSQCVYVLTY